jgi:NTE family protein
VLSVGGPAGVAHLGAIEAIRAARVPIRCVVGTSMGAVVGALYAADPGADTTARFVRFSEAYARATRAEANDRGRGGGILGALVGAMTGGVGAVVLGAVGGYFAGASTTQPVAHRRFVRVLQEELGGVAIENLPVPFTTLQQQRAENSARVEVVRRGPLVPAVGASAANPFIFSDLSLGSMQQFDPGMDRLAAIPADQACREHPGARLIVINVTRERVYREAGSDCEMIVVNVRVPNVPAQEALRPGPDFRAVVEAGRVATEAAIANYTRP